MEKSGATVRVEIFSDGVFAIAITLLVLDLKIPSEIDQLTDMGLWTALKTTWPSYMAFAFSFASIFIMWLNHHTIFRVVTTVDVRTMLANGILLFFVTLVPFPTSLLAQGLRTNAEHTAMMLYSGLFVLINLAYNLLWHSVSRNQGLKNRFPEETIRLIRNTYWIGLPLYLIAFGIAFYSAPVSLVVCIGLWFFWSLTTRKFVSVFKTLSI